MTGLTIRFFWKAVWSEILLYISRQSVRGMQVCVESQTATLSVDSWKDITTTNWTGRKRFMVNFSLNITFLRNTRMKIRFWTHNGCLFFDLSFSNTDVRLEFTFFCCQLRLSLWMNRERIYVTTPTQTMVHECLCESK